MGSIAVGSCAESGIGATGGGEGCVTVTVTLTSANLADSAVPDDPSGATPTSARTHHPKRTERTPMADLSSLRCEFFLPPRGILFLYRFPFVGEGLRSGAPRGTAFPPDGMSIGESLSCLCEACGECRGLCLRLR